MAQVSILLPVYNGARHLSAAIESVLAQTFEDWVLIICDDRSTDDSQRIITAYAEKDKRIHLQINERNLGLFGNYNECLRLACSGSGRSEFVKPFAQDDVLDPQALERLLKVLMEQADVALVSCARSWIGDDGTATGSVRPFTENRKISGTDVILYNLIQLSNWVGEPSTVMFRASHAGDGFDEALFHYGDIDYWFRIVAQSHYYYLDEALCSFRRHAQSTSSKNLNGLYFAADMFRLGKKYRGYLEELGESEAHFFQRAVETAALNVDHLVRGEGLTAGKMLTAKRPNAGQTMVQNPGQPHSHDTTIGPRSTGTAGIAPGRDIDGAIDFSPERLMAVGGMDTEDAFREVAFHSLRYVTDLLYAYSDLQHRTDAEKEHLQQQLNNMRQSTSWKITAPLRNIMRNSPEA
jgi:glycosyltransferase involved in cell wall biosynthesis